MSNLLRKSPTTTRGDLIYRSAGLDARLAIGSAGKFVRAGASDPAWSWSETTSAQSASYTITDTDGFTCILVTTGASTRTVTLPAAANNAGRVIMVKKVDTGAAGCQIDGNASETISGDANFYLASQYDWARMVCDGAAWHLVGGFVREYATNSGSATNADDTTNFTNGQAAITGEPIKSFTVANKRRVRFFNPFKASDKMELQIQRGSGGPWLPITALDGATGLQNYIYQGATSYGMGLGHTTSGGISTTDVDVYFGTYAYANNASFAGAGAAWSGYTGFNWRVVKTSLF